LVYHIDIDNNIDIDINNNIDIDIVQIMKGRSYD